MECKLEEVKKWTCAHEKKEEVRISTQTAHTLDSNHPDIKCSWNGATPPPIATEHARHEWANNEQKVEQANHNKSMEIEAEAMETIIVDEEPKEGSISEKVSHEVPWEADMVMTLQEDKDQENKPPNDEGQDDDKPGEDAAWQVEDARHWKKSQCLQMKNQTLSSKLTQKHGMGYMMSGYMLPFKQQHL